MRIRRFKRRGGHGVRNRAPWIQKSSKAQQMLSVMALFLKAPEKCLLAFEGSKIEEYMVNIMLDLGYHGAVCFLHTWLLSSVRKKRKERKKTRLVTNSSKIPGQLLIFLFLFDSVPPLLQLCLSLPSQQMTSFLPSKRKGKPSGLSAFSLPNRNLPELTTTLFSH